MSTFKYNKPRNQLLARYASTDAIRLLDSEGPCTPQGVASSSIPARVPLPQLPAVLNIQAIFIAETLAPSQATEEIPITKANNPMVT
jgi:hypothetical protein